MMMIKSALHFLLLVSAAAGPAVVWKQTSGSTVFTSENVPANEMLADALGADRGDEWNGVIFLVGRGSDGSETLSQMASNLSGVAGKYERASFVHNFVSGLESADSLKLTAQASTGKSVVQVSLEEYVAFTKVDGTEMQVDTDGRLSKAAARAHKRARELSSAQLVLVAVPANAQHSELDTAVVNAIDNVGNVVLAGIRSLEEVKNEREMAQKRKFEAMKQAGDRRRRLDQQQQDDNNGNNNDLSGIYYVSMTPNILAGLLFFLLFSVTSWIGISCMGMIAGQDVYVSKMPSIGRES